MRSGLAQFRAAVHAGLQKALVACRAVDHGGTAQLGDVRRRVVRIILEFRRQIRADGIAEQIVAFQEIDVFQAEVQKSFIGSLIIAGHHGIDDVRPRIARLVVARPVLAEPQHAVVNGFEDILPASRLPICQHRLHAAGRAPCIVILRSVILRLVRAQITVWLRVFQNCIDPVRRLCDQPFITERERQTDESKPIVTRYFRTPPSLHEAPFFIRLFCRIGIPDHLRFQIAQMAAHAVTTALQLLAQPSVRLDCA